MRAAHFGAMKFNRCALLSTGVITLIGVVTLTGLGGPISAADIPHNAYAGQQSRGIKALSDAEVAELKNGDGMGMEIAAELNSYPGPRHVLALGRDLRLTESQTSQVSAIRDRMSIAARTFGTELI